MLPTKHSLYNPPHESTGTVFSGGCRRSDCQLRGASLGPGAGRYSWRVATAPRRIEGVGIPAPSRVPRSAGGNRHSQARAGAAGYLPRAAGVRPPPGSLVHEDRARPSRVLAPAAVPWLRCGDPSGEVSGILRLAMAAVCAVSRVCSGVPETGVSTLAGTLQATLGRTQS